MLKSWDTTDLHGTIISVEKSKVEKPDKVAHAVLPEED
jgi:hypothetical protein